MQAFPAWLVCLSGLCLFPKIGPARVQYWPRMNWSSVVWTLLHRCPAELGRTRSSFKPGCNNILHNWLKFSRAGLNMVWKCRPSSKAIIRVKSALTRVSLKSTSWMNSCRVAAWLVLTHDSVRASGIFHIFQGFDGIPLSVSLSLLLSFSFDFSPYFNVLWHFTTIYCQNIIICLRPGYICTRINQVALVQLKDVCIGYLRPGISWLLYR